jgi:dipeptidyl-peptidase 4
MKCIAFGVCLCVGVFGSLAAKSYGGGSMADYQRANGLDERTRNSVFRVRVLPHWFDGGDQLWYRLDLAGSEREYVVVNAVTGVRRLAFRASELATALSSAAGRTVSPSDVTLDPIEFSDSDRFATFEKFGREWRYDLDAKTLAEWHAAPSTRPAPLTQPRPEAQPRRSISDADSPDGQWEATARDGNLFLRSQSDGKEIQLGAGASADNGYDGQFFWSPDSSKLVALWTKDGDHRKVYLVQSSPPDQLQPKLLSYDYLKPGDQIPLTQPRLFEIKTRKQIPISDGLFPNPWSVEQIRWGADSSEFTFFYNQRGHQVLRIIAVDAATGVARAAIDERSKTFIDYNAKMFVHYVTGTDEIIWMSERDGWNHLYLYDERTGQVKNQITKGNWVVRGVDEVDEQKRQIWFHAGGIYPDQDPYYIHYCRVNFDGAGLVVMTAGDGTHTVNYSPDRRFLIDTYSRVDLPPVNELRRVEDGKFICTLEQADISALVKTGWKPPERFLAKGRDGKTDIYGLIFRPFNFDPAEKYPVVEDVYAGPQDSFVPKAFARYFSDQAMAELGFVVVKIDGMGTSNRSKAFHDVCWHNLGDAGFPDRILWMKAAASARPYMDLTRVGVYGTSAGGQSALRAVEAFSDFYKVAVADCGCHDNRMDKIWWNELWMGWPIGPWYAAQSNVTNAYRMNGKLLLIVGELDHNVDPASTMQVVNALIKANKDFDLLVIPNADHGQDGPYGARRRQDFLVRNLLGVEPRHG